MPQPSDPPPNANDNTPSSSHALGRWNLVVAFKNWFHKTLDAHPKLAALGLRKAPGGPTRQLTQEDYYSTFLFAQFNPVLDTTRGICAASKIAKVQQKVCRRAISLGSFSEAQGVFGSAALKITFLELAKEHQRKRSVRAPGSKVFPVTATAIDSSLLKALLRMDWAEWRHQGITQRAVRLHLKLNLVDSLPVDLQISAGRKCERDAFRELIRPGETYVGDRNYGRSHALLEQLNEQGCHYIIRLCENVTTEVVEQFPLSAADRAAGVVSDQLVRLGGKTQSEIMRMVTVQRPQGEEPILIITNYLDP